MAVFPQTKVPLFFACVASNQQRRVASQVAISAATIFASVAAAIIDVGTLRPTITASAGVVLDGSPFRGIISVATDALHF